MIINLKAIDFHDRLFPKMRFWRFFILFIISLCSVYPNALKASTRIVLSGGAKLIQNNNSTSNHHQGEIYLSSGIKVVGKFHQAKVIKEEKTTFPKKISHKNSIKTKRSVFKKKESSIAIQQVKPRLIIKLLDTNSSCAFSLFGSNKTKGVASNVREDSKKKMSIYNTLFTFNTRLSISIAQKLVIKTYSNHYTIQKREYSILSRPPPLA